MYRIPGDQLAFHGRPGGVKWRLSDGGVEVEGEGIARTRGEPRTAERAWSDHAEAINLAAVKYGVPVELIVATMCTESGVDATSFRKEPGYTSDAATPHRVSYGMMHTLLSTAQAMAAANGIPGPVTKDWLFTPANSIAVGTAYIAAQKAKTGLDPILVAAAYNSGGVTTSTSNRWRLVQFFSAQTPPHCDRYLQFLNDFWAVLSVHAVRPALSLWQYFHQTPFVFPVPADAPSPQLAQSGESPTEQSVQRYHDHLEKRHRGGWFPIGANTVWHGGVHLRTAEGARVVAFADGEVVAARLGEGSKGSGAYGSTRFVLVRHELTGRLLNEAAAGVVGKRWTGLKIRSAKGCNLRPEPTRAKTALGLLTGGDEVELVAAEPRAAEGFAWLEVKVKASATAALVGAAGWMAYLDDAVERVYAEPEHVFDPAARKALYSLYMHLGDERLDPTSPRLADLPWLQKDGKPDPALLDQLRGGGVVKLSAPVHAGDPLWSLGSYGSLLHAAPLVHWELFSEENLLPKLETAEDAAEDFQLHTKAIFSMVKQQFLGSDENLDAGEVAAFYQSDSQAPRLRRFACRFMSEWAVDPDAAVKNLEGRFNTWGLADRLRPYAWWRDAAANGVALPASPHVWHYHPVSFVELVGGLTRKVPPVVMPKAAGGVASAPAVAADSSTQLPVTPQPADVWAKEDGAKVPHFCQASAPWGARTLGSALTVAAAGCAITSVAMCLRFFGHDVDPKAVDEYLDDHSGYQGDSVIWQTALDAGSTPGKKKLTFEKFVSDKAQFEPVLQARLAANLPTIAWVDYGSDAGQAGNHFVVAVGRLASGQFVMNDPASTSGNGAADPSDDNLFNKTSRKQGYNVVKLITFTAA